MEQRLRYGSAYVLLPPIGEGKLLEQILRKIHVSPGLDDQTN